MPEWKDFLAAAIALLASFAGAYAAFALERRRRKDEERDKNIGATNRALYTIFNLWNFLEQFRKDAIEPHRGRPDAWLNTAATPTATPGVTTFNSSELGFLLQTKHADVFASLLLEEQRFAHALALVQLRASLVLDRVFPTFSAAGVKVGTPLSEADVEAILGTELTHKLKVITPALVTCVDEDLASLKVAYKDLRSAVSELYPNTKFIRVEF